jgi:hypothetical protein
MDISDQFHYIMNLIDRAELSKNPYDFVDARLALLHLRDDVRTALNSGQPERTHAGAKIAQSLGVMVDA